MMRLFAAALVVAGALAAHAAEPVAFVADLQGNATIEGSGKVAFLAELAAGTRLLLGTGATVSVTYASTGAEFTLQGPGEFLVAPAEVKAERGAAPRKRTVSVVPDPAVVARASRTANASLRMRGMGLQGSNKIALEFPVGGTRVTTLQPVLRWSGEADAEEFNVSVADQAGKEVWKGSVKPATAKPAVKLAPATIYTWTVGTPKGGKAEGRFETVSAAAMARADKSRASARTVSERVMHALVLQEMGATQEAKEAFAALARDRPDLPELAALGR
jgi:hypothetical protein